MYRMLSIASSFFAASFIVLAFLGLLALGSTAALADEPLTAYCGSSDDCIPETLGKACNASCCCTCAIVNQYIGCYTQDLAYNIDGCIDTPCGP